MGEQFLNHLVSSARVVVENVIAGVKRCRTVKEVLRLTKSGISDLVMDDCLWSAQSPGLLSSPVARLRFTELG